MQSKTELHDRTSWYFLQDHCQYALEGLKREVSLSYTEPHGVPHNWYTVRPFSQYSSSLSTSSSARARFVKGKFYCSCILSRAS